MRMLYDEDTEDSAKKTRKCSFGDVHGVAPSVALAWSGVAGILRI